jgi:hypothetical protein
MGTFRKVWKFGSTAVTWVLVIASVPNKVAPITPIYNFFAHYWSSLWFRVMFAVIATILIYIFDLIDLFRPKVNVSLMPSGGGSSDIVLRVQNDGQQGNFRAMYEIVGSRETCGYPINRTVL